MLNPNTTSRALSRREALQRAVRRFLGRQQGERPALPSPENSQTAFETPFRHDASYRRHTDVASEAAGSELLLVQLAQGTTYRLNGTGRAVWDLATQGLTPSEIAERLHAALGVSHEQLRPDVAALLDELLGRALLEPRECPDSTSRRVEAGKVSGAVSSP